MGKGRKMESGRGRITIKSRIKSKMGRENQERGEPGVESRR